MRGREDTSGVPTLQKKFAGVVISWFRMRGQV